MTKKIGVPFNSIFSWYIKKRLHQIDLFRKFPSEVQEETLFKLLKTAKNTTYGKTFDFKSISTTNEFINRLPIQEYKDVKPFVERLVKGEQNLLWPSEIKWFAKSSGTTTGKSKLIPVSIEALEECHYKGGKDLLSLYYVNHPGTQLFKGKHLIVGGSSQINHFHKNSYFGDLSAIIIKNLPWWCEWRRTPKRKITLLPEWEEKIVKMAESTIHDDVYIIAGVPSWTLVLLNRILEQNNKNILDIWPNLELYMHGGVNFNPYKEQFKKLIPSNKMNYVQTYNASEGFFGIQDLNSSDDMLLMLDYGIFYEFLPLKEMGKQNPKTILLNEVKISEQYALVISSNAGLWRYLIGDTIKFTCLSPYRIEVTGRTKEFINAFGEELIVENANKALVFASEKTNSTFAEYTACPIYMKNNQAGAHEWLIEFEIEPNNIEMFAEQLDSELKRLNSDYESKRKNNLTLSMPVIRSLKKGTFYNWLKKQGKLGGQNKVQRLSNNRKYVEKILAFDQYSK